MSEGELRNNRPAANQPREASEPRSRTRRINILSPIQVVEEAVRDISNNVRRTLETEYTDESADESASPTTNTTHVQVQRSIPFGELDESLLRNSVNDSPIHTHNHRHSQASHGEYSLISYESNLFENSPYYTPNLMLHTPSNTVPNISTEAVSREIERLSNTLARVNMTNTTGNLGDITVINTMDENVAGPSGIAAAYQGNTTEALLHELIKQQHVINERLRLLETQGNTRHETVYNEHFRDEHDHDEFDVRRTRIDIRNQPGPPVRRVTFRDAINMIPDFDGTSPRQLTEFLNACTCAMKHVNPEDQSVLLETIVCTKLKGKVTLEFQTKDIYSFNQLKGELETSYSAPRNTAHVQIEFCTVKQKSGESAKTYGQRVEKLSMELYESLIEGRGHTAEQKRTILQTIRIQALELFQHGLREETKVIVRSRHYNTLQEAILGASAEERANGNNGIKNRTEHINAQYKRNSPLQCQKCGKLGHHGRDCRSSRFANRFALQKPHGILGVNTVMKHCNYCKKNGHTRTECWSLNGRPENPGHTGVNAKAKPRYEFPRILKNSKQKKEKSVISSDDEEEDKRPKKLASEYHITQVTGDKQGKTGLDLINLPIQEARRHRVSLLYDTGATITFLKLRNLKDDTMIYEEKMVLTGVTGHKLHTLGQIKATIQLKDLKIKHPIYVVRDDFPMDYEGILGADFLRKYQNACDYRNHRVIIGGSSMKLFPHLTVSLKPRSETIIQANTDKNGIGVVRSEETKPGVFIGSCLVAPEDFSCPVSIINTTEEPVELPTPYVTIDKIIEAPTANVNITCEKATENMATRIERIRKVLRTQHLNTEEEKDVQEICEKFNDIFYLQGDHLTHTTKIKHEISTRIDSAPVNIRPYRLPEKHKEEVNRQVTKMLKEGIIRPSVSQWNAPLLVVPKKIDASGELKMRVVVDFRRVNDCTIGDSFPLPNITDILDQLGNAKYFSTLDLASGYHQIPMEEQDKCKTAFSTTYGHYEFNRMPFGLKNAPATFQRLMNTILVGLQGLKCLVYLDDIVIYGSSLKEHNKRLIEVLKRLRESNLKLQPDKCEFLRKEVTYLGHVITENGIMPDPSKTKAVKEFPVPTKVKDIQAFIGLAGYYRKFIENFSKIAKPLTELTKKGNKFEWNKDQQTAFNMLKEKLITAPVLTYPNFNKEFLVTTDASDYAIGAVLSQGTIGQDRPIAYASRILARAEKNYNTTEKELLAIVWAVKNFRPYLYGTKFKIITDHKPLIWLFSVNDPGSRLIRWRLKLEEYDYEIVHKAGKANVNADALSRHVSNVENESAKYSAEEKSEANIYTEEDKRSIMYEYHDTPLGGHQGVERTIKRIRLVHNWPGMTKDVENYITKCELCQKNKLQRKFKAPLIITDTPSKAFEKCALDIVGPLTVTEKGHKYVLTFQDSLTKFSKAIPLTDQGAAKVAKEFVTKIILEYGIPDQILTDQGTNFLSQLFRNVCKLLRIAKIQTTAYHPQSNGALERSHRTLAEYLRHYINPDQTDWDEWLPYAMFTYNTTPHTATGFTPFELIYGHQAPLPTTLTKSPRTTYTYDDYAHELREKIRATQQVAKEHLKEEKLKAKLNYDKKTKKIIFAVGDKVLLYDETVRRGRSKKLDSLWIGPYTIMEKCSEVNYAIKRGKRTLKVHINRLKAFIEN